MCLQFMQPTYPISGTCGYSYLLNTKLSYDTALQLSDVGSFPKYLFILFYQSFIKMNLTPKV